MMTYKKQGLVADLYPNIRLMKFFGHFMFNYYSDNSGALHALRVGYSCMHLVLVLLQYGWVPETIGDVSSFWDFFRAIFGNLVSEMDDVNDLAANTITILFFTHCVTKYVYFAVRSKMFYRWVLKLCRRAVTSHVDCFSTLGIWNQANSHPLFVESNNRFHALSLTKMRRLLMIVLTGTTFSATGTCWTREN